MDRGKLILKSASIEDLDKIHKWLNCDDILKFFGGRDKKMSRNEIEDEYSPENNPNVLMIIVDNKPMGFIDIFKFSSKNNIDHGLQEDETDIYSFDILIGELEYQNKGYGGKAVDEALSLLFNEKGVSKVVLDTYLWHKQAIRCYEKCGFKVTRVLMDHDIYEGQKVDDVFMEITKEDYFSIK